MSQLIKIIILGNSGAGKSCLVGCFVDGKFNEKVQATIGAEFTTKALGDTVLQLWDTAGQERFHSLGSGYWRGAAGCVLVFDLTSIDSFNSLNSWREDFVSRLGEGRPIVVVGTKGDLDTIRVVSDNAIADWCKHHCLPYYEVSSKFKKNIHSPFESIAALCKAHPILEDDDSVLSLANVSSRYKKNESKRCKC